MRSLKRVVLRSLALKYSEAFNHCGLCGF